MYLDVRVQTGDFDVAAEYAALRERLPASAGAVVSFVGLVRDLVPDAVPDATPNAAPNAAPDGAPDGAADARPGEARLRGLHLEHYPGMTERSIEAIAREAERRWPLDDLVIVHRVGDLPPTAQIVYVQAASAHRAAAFAACEMVMDYLKTDAVFWKREDTAAGSRWIESTAEDRGRVNDWRRADSSAGSGKA